MSTTNYLNLNKHDNVTTNQNAFDIENHLNGNWDKIDQEASSQNTLIQRLKKNQIYGTATGTEVEITDSAEMGASIGVGGESEQETRSGKNIFDPNNPSETSSATVSFNNDIVTVSSTATNTQPSARWVYENLSVGDVFRINSILLDSNCMIILQGYNGQSFVTIKIFSYSDGVSESSYSYTVPSGITSIRYLLYSSTTIPTGNISARYKNVIITKNNSDLTYEQYGAMPSPEYPSEIKNLTGNTLCKVRGNNMWHNNVNFPITKNGVTLEYDEETNIYTLNGTSTSGSFFRTHEGEFSTFKTGDTLTTSIYKVGGSASASSTNILWVGGYNEKDGNSWVGNCPISATQSENSTTQTLERDGMTHATIWVITSGITFNNFKFKVQLEKGPTKTDYEPYQEKTITFPFGEQKLAKGDYLASDGIHNLKNKNTINISAIVTLGNGNKGGVAYLTNKIYKSNNYLLCSKAIFDKERTQGEGTVYENEGNIIFVGNSSDTLETLQDKFDGAIIEYELSQPIVAPYTQAQQEAYNNLQNLILFEGYNHIEMISPNGVKANLTVDYIVDTKTYIDTEIQKVKNAIISLGGVV